MSGTAATGFETGPPYVITVPRTLVIATQKLPRDTACARRIDRVAPHLALG